jgi:hypothetical protein
MIGQSGCAAGGLDPAGRIDADRRAAGALVLTGGQVREGVSFGSHGLREVAITRPTSLS